jgi:hypothetical protein
MKRFAIEITQGNNTRILGTYDTKEQGYEVGRSYSQALSGSGGVVALVYRDFNEENKPTSNEEKIFEVWAIPKQ